MTPADGGGAPPTGDLWSYDGPVAAAFASLGRAYEPRDDQRKVAGLVGEALARQASMRVGILPIEAGTGIGKTLAYLVPGALHAVATGSRMLVSTHTIALGAQILGKDGPVARAVVEAATGRRPQIAHMRGRTHFASPSRARAVATLMRDDGLPASAWRPYLDLAEAVEAMNAMAAEALADDDTSASAEALVAASLLDTLEEAAGMRLARDDVHLARSSPKGEDVAHRLGLALAKEAVILVTTHAYTANALARRALFGAADHLFDMLVVDEADQWASAAASASLVATSTSGLHKAVSELLGADRHAKAGGKAAAMAEAAMGTLDALQAMAPGEPDAAVAIAPGNPALGLLRTLHGQAMALVAATAGRRGHTAAASDALGDAMRDVDRILTATEPGEAGFWTTEWTTSRVLGLPSIRIRGRAPGRIMKRLWNGPPDAEPLARTIVLTSATLTTPGFGEGARWKSIELATGADPNSGMVLTDLAGSVQPTKMGRMRVRFADPSAPVPHIRENGILDDESVRYAATVVQAAMADAASRGGRTLVLVPSYADVERLGSWLPGAMTHQRGQSMREVVDAYEATAGCCLVTPGAWYGVDLPGMVQDLVITRTPYPPKRPGEAMGMGRMLADTLAKISQGLGRAIRCPSDETTVWFADPRMSHPECVTEETGILPSAHANAILLSAIPRRFRLAFESEPGTAAIGPAYLPSMAKPVATATGRKHAKEDRAKALGKPRGRPRKAVGGAA